jgi:thymidine phosphorylase
MVAALGGPADFVETWRAHLPAAPVRRAVLPERAGRVAAVATEALGLTVVRLGGGRRTETDRVDPAVGLTGIARLGAEVGPDRPLAEVHAASEDAADRAEREVRAAFTLGEALAEAPLILERVGP